MIRIEPFFALSFAVAALALSGCGDVDHPATTPPPPREQGETGPGACDARVEPAPADACQGATWAQSFQDTAGMAGIGGVAVTRDCQVVLTGTFDAEVDLGGGPLQSNGDSSFVARYDALGNHLWSKRLSSGSYETVRMVVDPDGAVLLAAPVVGTYDLGCGETLAEGIGVGVTKLGADGECLWTTVIGEQMATASFGLAVDACGNAVVGAGFTGELDTSDTGAGTQSTALVVAKLDADGEPVWQRVLDGSGTEWFWTLTVDGSNDVVMVASTSGPLDLGGATLPLSDPDKGDGVFVAKLDATGEYVWSHRLPRAPALSVFAVAANRFDEVVLGGTYNGATDLGFGTEPPNVDGDAFALVLDASGAPLWRTTFGGSRSDAVGGVAFDQADNVLFTGSFYRRIVVAGTVLSSDSDRDGFLLRYGRDGGFLSGRVIGGSADGVRLPASIAVDASDNVLLTGSHFGDAQLDGTVLPAASEYAGFLFRVPEP